MTQAKQEKRAGFFKNSHRMTFRPHHLDVTENLWVVVECAVFAKQPTRIS